MEYFKTKKKEKCLATLDLLRVGTIEMDPSDTSGCTFTIEVAGRPYYLCADTKEKATDWCINLNRSKEARANLGGMCFLHEILFVCFCTTNSYIFLNLRFALD